LEALSYQTQQEIKRPNLRLVYDVDSPLAISVHDSETEKAASTEFQIWRGKIASSNVRLQLVGSSESISANNDTDILQRIIEARAGSAEASEWLDPNIGSAVSEALFKDRHITEKFADLNEDGEIIQSGQPMSSIQANSYNLRPKNRHPILKKITDAEALNSFRIKHKLKSGGLRDNVFVAVSLVPNDVPEQQLGHKGDGYFLERFTLAIQATSEEEGLVKIESGFMAGVDYDPKDSFQDKMAKRRDFEAVAKVYKYLGLEVPLTAEEILDSSFTVPKYMIPNGVADLMRLMDIANDQIAGQSISRPAEDYIKIKNESRKKESKLMPVIKQVKAALLSGANGLSTPHEATQLLSELVRKYALEESYTNEDIDPLAFGKQAATYIVQIREQLTFTNFDDNAIQHLMRMSDHYAIVTLCGGGSGIAEIIKGEGLSSLVESSVSEESTINKEKNVLRCGNCPECHEPYDEIKAKDGKFTCEQCGASTPAK
jgi:hypothetical protein